MNKNVLDRMGQPAHSPVQRPGCEETWHVSKMTELVFSVIGRIIDSKYICKELGTAVSVSSEKIDEFNERF